MRSYLALYNFMKIGVELLTVFITFGFVHGNEWIRKTYLY